MNTKYQLLIFICFFFAFDSISQVSLIKDINTAPADLQAGNDYTPKFCQCDNKLYFGVRNELGSELWKTDGTEGGTTLVSDLNKHSPTGVNGYLNDMVCLNNKLFFVGNDGTGNDIWSTDGTDLGTVLIKDLSETVPNMNVHFLKQVGSYFFFIEQLNGAVRIWKSDGTTPGTEIVRVFENVVSSQLARFRVCGGSYFYFALIKSSGSGYRYELWRSDGFEEGTIMLMETDQLINSLTPAEDRIFFGSGNDLWVSDGKPEGTMMIKAFNAVLQNFFAFNNKVIFSALYETWISDGTDGGTFYLSQGPIHAGRVYENEFYGKGQRFPSANFMIKTNGSVDGTTHIALASSPSSGTWISGELPMIDDKFIIPFDDGSHGAEPGISDWTVEGTYLLKDIFIGNQGSMPRCWASLDEKIYFLAGDHDHGHEIWVTDGTGENTYLLKDIKPETANAFSIPYYFKSLKDRAFLLGTSVLDNLMTVWTTDGSEQGTYVSHKSTGFSRFLGSSDSHLYFEESPYLIRLDGLEGGVEMIKDIGSQGSGVTDFGFNLGNRFIFEASTVANGREYWSTDGTADGTFILKDIYPGGQSGLSLYPAAVLETKLIFSANDGINGIELWITDGTTEGTNLLKDINSGVGNSSPTYFIQLNELLFFSADDGTHGVELWRTDGSPEGTLMIKDIFEAGNSSPRFLQRVENKVVFTAYDDVRGWAVWSTAGASENTILVKDIIPGNDPNQFPEMLTTVESKVFFVADDGVHGKELWVSDGTEAGTRVLDLNPGIASSSPTLLTNVNGFLYFQKDGALWRTDGTVANTTVVVSDMEPLSIRYFDGYVYFVAYSKIYGTEWFRVPFTKFDQSITFQPIPEKVVGGVPFVLEAHASSGLPVTFSTQSSNVSISGNLVEIIAPGSTTISANSGATTFYNAAEEVTETFCIDPAKPVITVSDANSASPTLTSSSNAGSSWFLNGELIATDDPVIEVTESGIYTLQITIDNCVSAVSDGLNLVITSAENGQRSIVSFSPNPTTDYLTIRSSGRCTVNVMDVTGKILSSYDLKDRFSVDHFVGEYAPGLYLLKITTPSSSSAYRFVKE